MSTLRSSTPLLTTAVAALAGAATIAHWPAAPILRATALSAVVLCAVIHYGETHLAAIRQLRREIGAYGEDRYIEGSTDAAERTVPGTPLQSVRR